MSGSPWAGRSWPWPGTPAYDAALHALLLGFVFSMVFGHAPIILPAVLRVALPYHRSFYVPLQLLHASVALRLLGDALARFELTRWGALGSALALAAFIAVMITPKLCGSEMLFFNFWISSRIKSTASSPDFVWIACFNSASER